MKTDMAHSPDRRRPERIALSSCATRRQFISTLVAGAAAVGCSGAAGGDGEVLDPRLHPRQLDDSSPDTGRRVSSTDQVLLGNTGIRVSRLAMGSGTHGYAGSSDQTRLGLDGFSSLLVHSYERGITFWEAADQYGSHAHLKRAIAQVGRQNVVILTKTHAETEAQAQADLERFLTELGTDYIDVLLLHNRQSARWTAQCAGAMQYMADAKRRGVIRAHGVSCHTLDALRLAARTPWVDVDLARINPAGLHMDAAPETVLEVLREMKAAGKAVIGMKILGQGELASKLDVALRHATSLDCVDAFTIGFKSRAELGEVQTKIQNA